MALETLKDVENVGGFDIIKEMPYKVDGTPDWGAFDEMRKRKPISVNQDVNMISFRLQKGPIKEVGVNGCQVDTLIETVKLILEGLNQNYPCRENAIAITKLDEAILWLNKRKADREKRGVEGFDKP